MQFTILHQQLFLEFLLDLQLTKLSYNAAIVERSGVAGKIMQVSKRNSWVLGFRNFVGVWSY